MTTADAGGWQAAEEEEPRGPVGKAFRLSAADSLSLGNALCGFLAVCVLAASVFDALRTSGDFTPAPGYFATAVVLLLIGATCDLFDGLVARRFRASAMGAELDNLADVISFGFAPAFMVVIWGGFTDAVPFAAVVTAAAAVLVAGVVRLARFACVKTKSGDFMGLPIPMGAMTVISIVLLFEPSVWTLLGVLAVAWLMVSRIEYPKPKGQLAAVVLAWIMVNVAFLTFWVAWPEGGDMPIKIGATMQIALVAAIPLRMMFYKRELRREAARLGQ
ncbi:MULTISPECIES: CDP-diacylglycerol--serine O-phosphatidyltransferase [Nonomuraea]|uniref:CDP-diacylglycerol--serine O-phosphatidyltransferase n=2 Tax=Nonomuraea TaxID=83681 RepID=A0ABW1C508_9ACTN|nr:MULTISPECIES: CDP-diacylglycerol--serine O-phosphatidyltransferase [Nonomuraea]MDA0647156.1 CDP-diacylglycerol--serine O-phosphatidyltransferase [Nonomuraea ferruginea]TXK40436.1 CDP-diacylglycerol--serine O-phosphatidyltransferase [Nonomuraea sp. C10]